MSTTTILIVEDERIVALDLAGKLEQLGYEVAGTAMRGDEAVTLARRLRPNLVLMDISLEGPLDGIEAVEAIHREQDVPVVYLTAHSDPATLTRAKLTGPFGYILKPFEFATWRLRSNWPYTATRPTGNSASSGSGCASRSLASATP